MKLSLAALSAVVAIAAAAKKGNTKARKDTGSTKQQRTRDLAADEQFFAQAFGAINKEGRDASEWKNFLSEDPLPSIDDVDPTDRLLGEYNEANNNEHDNDRELWYHHSHKKGWFSIDADESALEITKKNTECCFDIGEGIEKDGWKFGIANDKEYTDTYLQLFDEWWPYMPVYQYFKGAKKLCIGEESHYNAAYLYIVLDWGCWYLVGKPDSGRRDHYPKLKIRDQDRRRQRQRKLRAATKEDNAKRDLWASHNDYYHDKDVVLRFRDGPGIYNSFWQM